MLYEKWSRLTYPWKRRGGAGTENHQNFVLCCQRGESYTHQLPMLLLNDVAKANIPLKLVTLDTFLQEGGRQEQAFKPPYTHTALYSTMCGEGIALWARTLRTTKLSLTSEPDHR